MRLIFACLLACFSAEALAYSFGKVSNFSRQPVSHHILDLQNAICIEAGQDVQCMDEDDLVQILRDRDAIAAVSEVQELLALMRQQVGVSPGEALVIVAGGHFKSVVLGAESSIVHDSNFSLPLVTYRPISESNVITPIVRLPFVAGEVVAEEEHGRFVWGNPDGTAVGYECIEYEGSDNCQACCNAFFMGYTTGIVAGYYQCLSSFAVAGPWAIAGCTAAALAAEAAFIWGRNKCLDNCRRQVWQDLTVDYEYEDSFTSHDYLVGAGLSYQSLLDANGSYSALLEDEPINMCLDKLEAMIKVDETGRVIAEFKENRPTERPVILVGDVASELRLIATGKPLEVALLGGFNHWMFEPSGYILRRLGDDRFDRANPRDTRIIVGTLIWHEHADGRFDGGDIAIVDSVGEVTVLDVLDGTRAVMSSSIGERVAVIGRLNFIGKRSLSRFGVLKYNMLSQRPERSDDLRLNFDPTWNAISLDYNSPYRSEKWRFDHE